MRNILLFTAILTAPLIHAQTNAEIKSELDKIQTDISSLRTEIQSVKSQNIYLKKVLDINTPVGEQVKDNTRYAITRVSGSKKDKTISIDFLIESKNEFKTAILQDIVMVDIEGNQYKMNYIKSSHNIPVLSVDVPVKLTFLFDNIIGEPLIVKLFRFSARNEPKANSFNATKSDQEFRDLNVNWQ